MADTRITIGVKEYKNLIEEAIILDKIRKVVSNLESNFTAYTMLDIVRLLAATEETEATEKTEEEREDDF